MFIDLVKANRSYRGYDESRKVTRDELLSLVELARISPSSLNAQPLKYYIAYEKEKVEIIQARTKWAAGLPKLNLPYEGKRPTAFIVICQDLNIVPAIEKYQKDVGIVAQTMLLGATELGLGGCMIGNFSQDEMKKAIGVSENLQPVLVIGIGKPMENIVITEVSENESMKYYRDENDTHYVPKRKLQDIVVE